MDENESFTRGVFLGTVFMVIVFIVLFALTPANTAEMCKTLSDNDYPTVYVEDINECRYLTESGELVPFELVPMK